MTSIRGHPDLNCWGGGDTFDSHFSALSCSGSILFAPKCFSNFQGSLNLRMSLSHPPFPHPFPRAPTLLSPPTSSIWKSQAKTSYYKFKFWHSNLLVGKVSKFVMFCVYFFFVPSMWQKLIINFFVKLKNLPSFFLSSSLCFSTWLIWRSWIESLVPDKFVIVIDVS